jgi:hypothetical protein
VCVGFLGLLPALFLLVQSFASCCDQCASFFFLFFLLLGHRFMLSVAPLGLSVRFCLIVVIIGFIFSTHRLLGGVSFFSFAFFALLSLFVCSFVDYLLFRPVFLTGACFRFLILLDVAGVSSLLLSSLAIVMAGTT